VPKARRGVPRPQADGTPRNWFPWVIGAVVADCPMLARARCRGPKLCPTLSLVAAAVAGWQHPAGVRAPGAAAASDALLDSVTPSHGSAGGGTLLTIRASVGLTFADAAWPANASAAQLARVPTVGLQVLVGDIPCDLQPQYYSLGGGLVVCRTRTIGDGLMEAGFHPLPVSVALSRPGLSPLVLSGAAPNGTFEYRGLRSGAPVVTRVVPAAALPGELVTVFGRGIPAPVATWPGQLVVLLGGNLECPQQEGMAAASGYVQCRLPVTTPPGSYNVSFHVWPHGSSLLAASALQQDRAGVVHALHVYGRVLSVRPRSGSAAGGTLLTVSTTGLLAGGPAVSTNTSIAVSLGGYACALVPGSLHAEGFACRLASASPAEQLRRDAQGPWPVSG
jgi:hypothetical protein